MGHRMIRSPFEPPRVRHRSYPGKPVSQAPTARTSEPEYEKVLLAVRSVGVRAPTDRLVMPLFG